MNTIGMRIKNIRELRGYPQKYVADKLKMTQAGYSKIERGESDVAYSKLEEISKVLEVSIEDLMAFDQQKFLNSFNNVKGSNSNIVINDIKDVKKLYEDKILLLEKLLKIKEDRLTNYEEKFGDIN
jgi:transcriptional regulator with XRE-family HTH domain